MFLSFDLLTVRGEPLVVGWIVGGGKGHFTPEQLERFTKLPPGVDYRYILMTLDYAMCLEYGTYAVGYVPEPIKEDIARLEVDADFEFSVLDITIAKIP